MRFLIYIPGQDSDCTAKDLFERVGLGEIASGLDVKQSDGPDEGRGKLCGWLSSTQNQLIYKPEAQTWIPSAKAGDRESGVYWVGTWNDAPPTEEDLRKPNHRRGSFIKLGNGERWSIVVPQDIDRFPLLNSDGTLTWVADEAYNWMVTSIDKRRADALSTINEDGSVEISFNFAADWQFLVSVLQINYRVTPEIVSHLRLFSQQAIKELIAALMGMPLQTA
ncbi:MAG: hypothetical protein KDB01_11455 [Planctomycetaceae bacterium]|nr:hypothetical protein [Planctomycetaceae bacterium]